jgi:hypothetical protein
MAQFPANPCGVSKFAALYGMELLLLDAASLRSTKRSEGQICNFVVPDIDWRILVRILRRRQR